MDVMKISREETYLAPEAEVLEIGVEHGFALSGDTDDYEDGGNW